MPYCEIPANTIPGEEKHRIHYSLFGNGPHKIILLMGVGGTSAQWQQQIDYFTAPERKDKFQILAIENRGIGLSDPVAGRWTTSKLALDAIHVMDSLGWKDDIHVVGLSMGGMIAQEVCKHGKGRFASLTLLSTIAGGLYSLYYFILSIPSGVRMILNVMIASNMDNQLKSALRILYPDSFLRQKVPDPKDPSKMTTNFHICKEILMNRALEEEKKGIPLPSAFSMLKQVFAVMSHNVTVSQLQEISKSVNGNVLVVTGDEDILVHMQNSVRLNETLKGKMMVLKAAGHGAYEQYAPEVNAAIEELILKAAAASSAEGNHKLTTNATMPYSKL